eukprot:CAMPEP_0201677608 /NCGR_PEP_ID=MMETSP0494-20130426/44498_1 /ASSEMBLY_ACC=CAM_ASM_000839 /TAXON_ID=420259 /ORGANISM="Thalassiosira gravida, Strain GMp14c1" /LENGTH=267 /DNA_ID=CAMNT_0048160599 /DNA_START=183 /DNA_END=984 /DNA_ORIENTATION=-
MTLCPHAASYTYINGDIIGTQEFVETIDACKLKFDNFFMVGRRTNVRWKVDGDEKEEEEENNNNNKNKNSSSSNGSSTYDRYDAAHPSFDFQSHLRTGALFVPNAIDYFTFTKDVLDWSIVPPFVVGRAAYDSWLVDTVYRFQPGSAGVDEVMYSPNINNNANNDDDHDRTHNDVALIDATVTAPVIHQTDDNGDFSWGRQKKTSSSSERNATRELEDTNYNLRLAKWGNSRRKFGKGKTENAPWETLRDEKGRIGVHHREFDLFGE